MDQQDNAPQQAPAAAPAAAQNLEPRYASLSTGAWLVVLLYPLVIAAATLWWSNRQAAERMEQLIAQRPDIAVVDDIALIQLAIDNGADRYNAGEVLAEISKIVKDNGLDNTILLSKSMTLFAPDANKLEVATEPKQPVRRELRR